MRWKRAPPHFFHLGGGRCNSRWLWGDLAADFHRIHSLTIHYPSPSSDKSIYSQENIHLANIQSQFWQIYLYQIHNDPVQTKNPSPWQSSSDKFTFLSNPKPWVLFCHWLTDHCIYHSRGMDFPIPPFWFCFEIGITESTSTTTRSKAITSIIQQRPLWI